MSNKRVYLGRNGSGKDVEIQYVDKHKPAATGQLVVKELGDLKIACSKSQADTVAQLKKEQRRQREKLGKEMDKACKKPLDKIDRIMQELTEAQRELCITRERFLNDNKDRTKKLDKITRDLNVVYSSLYDKYAALSSKASTMSATERQRVLLEAQKLVESVVISTEEERDQIEAFRRFFSGFGKMQMFPQIAMDAPLSILF